MKNNRKALLDKLNNLQLEIVEVKHKLAAMKDDYVQECQDYLKDKIGKMYEYDEGVLLITGSELTKDNHYIQAMKLSRYGIRVVEEVNFYPNYQMYLAWGYSGEGMLPDIKKFFSRCKEINSLDIFNFMNYLKNNINIVADIKADLLD